MKLTIFLTANSPTAKNPRTHLSAIDGPGEGGGGVGGGGGAVEAQALPKAVARGAP